MESPLSPAIYGRAFVFTFRKYLAMLTVLLFCTCANEYAHKEYIPANLSRYTIVRSVAIYG